MESQGKSNTIVMVPDYNSPRPRPKRSEVPIQIPTLFSPPPPPLPATSPTMHLRHSRPPFPGPPPRPSPSAPPPPPPKPASPRAYSFPHPFASLHCCFRFSAILAYCFLACAGCERQPSMRCKLKVLDTKHRPICFHFLPVFKIEFLSLLSNLIACLPRLFPPPSSFSSPPSLLFFVSHPIPSVFPYDGELQL